MLAWGFYHFVMERGGRLGLNRRMDGYRMQWMHEMAKREVLVTEASIIASLQNGTALFASTSLLAIGGAAILLRANEEAIKITTELPFGFVATRSQWDAKIIGIMLILGYAFYKFSWAYRLFNYSAILLGATPDARSPDEPARIAAA